MNQVPHITQEHRNDANRAVPVYATFVGVFNKAIKIALAEANAEQEQPSTLNFEGLSFVEIAAKAIELEMIRQSDKAVQEFEVMESELEQPLLTAQEARKLGAGNAEYSYDGRYWGVCTKHCEYLAIGHCGQVMKYRAIKQLKQVSWKDVPVGVMTNKGELRKVYQAPVTKQLQATIESPNLSDSSLIKRSEYECSELELAPASKQPWLNWRGGNCPVPEGVIVEVTLRAGDTSSDMAQRFHWEHRVDPLDIIEYRVTGIAKGWELK